MHVKWADVRQAFPCRGFYGRRRVNIESKCSLPIFAMLFEFKTLNPKIAII